MLEPESLTAIESQNKEGRNNISILDGKQLFTLNTKEIQYATTKDVLIPFDSISSNCGKFNSVEDALVYIELHCMKYHLQCKRSLIMKYCNLCQVVDVVNRGYIPLASLGQKAISKAITKVFKKSLHTH